LFYLVNLDVIINFRKYLGNVFAKIKLF